ncbi:hypothetical protein [Bacillus sp. P14.5]|uniref:hypothetical protein n=1 Tax=Bacillus sp. P14.5 TaxID=1983400 RepID=UPI000DEBB60F|nr:hypothetical protein [Bacillus sp. P14.5]
MGKVGQVYNGIIDWNGNELFPLEDPYYDEIKSHECRNEGCLNILEMTDYEYDNNEKSVYCIDCLERHGSKNLGIDSSINSLEILNDPNGVNKCLKNFGHDISILSDLGCFQCSINSIKLLQGKQTYFNEQRKEGSNIGEPTEVDGILFRSKGESILYNKLKRKDQELIYEMFFIRTFINGKKEYYNPDFYLPKFNLFIEYRGYNADDKVKKHQWKKTFYFGEQIRKGLKNHLDWNNDQPSASRYCSFLVLAPRNAYYYKKGKKYILQYKKCSKCSEGTVFLDIFNYKCINCRK